MTRILLLLCLSTYCYAQTPNSESLISVHNVDNVSTMNNISNPQKGHLIFVESTSTLYFYDGSDWVSTISSGSGGTADGDAWGVSGENIGNPISRNGKVTIGTGLNTDTVNVNGSARITNLPTGLNLRSMVHESDVSQFGGVLQSNFFRRYYNNTPSSSWLDLSSGIGEGFIVTGRYFYDASPCSSPSQASGHFQFRYYHNTNTFELVYNTGNASFNTVTVGAETEYRITTTHCSNQAGVSFKKSSSPERLQIKANGTAYRLDFFVDGY